MMGILMIETMMIDGPSAQKQILKCLLGIVPTWADLNCHRFFGRDRTKSTTWDLIKGTNPIGSMYGIFACNWLIFMG